MEGSVGVVHLKMSPLGAVFLDMNGVHGHGVRISAEHGGLVHIIPETVHVVATLEDVVVEQASPVFLGILVKEVDPS